MGSSTEFRKWQYEREKQIRKEIAEFILEFNAVEPLDANELECMLRVSVHVDYVGGDEYPDRESVRCLVARSIWRDTDGHYLPEAAMLDEAHARIPTK